MNQSDISFILSSMATRGAEFISSDFKNAKSKIYFRCASCMAEHYTTMNNFKSGRNLNFLCKVCSGQKAISIAELKETFSNKGAELLSSDYKNVRSKLYFKCSRCGNTHYTTLEIFRLGCNPNLLCEDCQKGNCFKPQNNYGDGKTGGHRHLIDSFWLGLIKDFFNILDKDSYSSHHIKPYASYPEQRTSLTNGFPLKKEYHSNSYTDPSTNIKNPFHKDENFMNPEFWGNYCFLPTYSKDFYFTDLSKYMITEIIPVQTNKTELYNKKRDYHEKGILYIPFYFEELYRGDKVQISLSMIRHRLFKNYEKIYEFTQQKFTVIYARKCELKVISSSTAKDFFSKTHIQGFTGSVVYLGLFYESKLVAAMSFSNIRNKYDKDPSHFELTRFSTELNCSVVGAAGKLFKYFIRNYNPTKIISYCDIRFSSIAPEDTVYHKLGFKYDGYSRPNYKYLHIDSNKLYSRQTFQKYKLKEKLENFNDTLTEAENMSNNGYTQVYDCGNFRFIWELP